MCLILVVFTHFICNYFLFTFSAIVLAFNIPGVQSLILNRDLLVGIHNGTYKFWNSSAIQAENPSTSLPGERIVVAARADRSGSTEIFTTALSRFSEAWRKTYGIFNRGLNKKGATLHWNESEVNFRFGRRICGIVDILQTVSYSLGHMALYNAEEAELSVAAIRNKAGNVIEANSQTVHAAMDDFLIEMTSTFTVSLSDGPGEGSYPIAGYTYCIVRMNPDTNCRSFIELQYYIEWFLYNSQARADSSYLNMAPVTLTIADKIKHDILHEMTCNGNPLHQLLLDLQTEEQQSTETWRTPVAITVPCVCVLFISLLVYMMYQRYKFQNLLDRNDWDIPIEDILFSSPNSPRRKSFFSGSGTNSKSMTTFDSFDLHDSSVAEIIHWPGKWLSNTIGLRVVEIQQLHSITTKIKRTILWMKDSVSHDNVLRFYGLTLLDGERYIVNGFCAKGGMKIILRNSKLNLNDSFKTSLTTDIAQGMIYLHNMDIVHGNLKSLCCLIDERWVVKISDWEFLKILSAVDTSTLKQSMNKNKIHPDTIEDDTTASEKFWTAPEVLLSNDILSSARPSDVYSYAIIVHEIFAREDPYIEHTDNLSGREILRAIMSNGLRPQHFDDVPVTIKQIMEIAWADDPLSRPSFEQILKLLHKSKSSKKSVLDSMMETMEEYAIHLEKTVEAKETELEVMKTSMHTVFSTLVPADIAKRLVNGQCVMPETYTDASVMLLEITGVDDNHQNSFCEESVKLLYEINVYLDRLLKNKNIFKLDFSVTSFLLISSRITSPESTLEMCYFSLEFLNWMENCPYLQPTSAKCKARCSMHIGEVVTGLVGSNVPRFVVLGQSVQFCQSLIKHCHPMTTLVSKSIYNSLASTKGIMTEIYGNLLILVSITLYLFSVMLAPRSELARKYFAKNRILTLGNIT